jgi:hypothetical protein
MENTLLTSDGTGIVRSFGIQRRIVVPRGVEILQKSWFELLHSLIEVKFEDGPKLKGPLSKTVLDSRTV